MLAAKKLVLSVSRTWELCLYCGYEEYLLRCTHQEKDYDDLYDEVLEVCVSKYMRVTGNTGDRDCNRNNDKDKTRRDIIGSSFPSPAPSALV